MKKAFLKLATMLLLGACQQNTKDVSEKSAITTTPAVVENPCNLSPEFKNTLSPNITCSQGNSVRQMILDEETHEKKSVLTMSCVLKGADSSIGTAIIDAQEPDGQDALISAKDIQKFDHVQKAKGQLIRMICNKMPKAEKGDLWWVSWFVSNSKDEKGNWIWKRAEQAPEDVPVRMTATEMVNEAFSLK